MNIGETDELKAILTLIYHRDNKENNCNINSVGFGLDHNYKPHNLNLQDILDLTEGELINQTNKCGLKKSPPSYKADIYINNIPCSLKSTRGSKPALLNHTHRDGMIKVMNRINKNIANLDVLVAQYWQDRLSKKHNEDVKFSNSAFAKNRPLMVEILSYFMFTGTAKKDSPHPARYLISLDTPVDIKKWKKLTPINAAENIIDTTTVSMREKGMPGTFSLLSNRPAHKNIAPWIAGDLNKGSLHIRY